MLTLDVALIPYDRTPGFGPDHLLARLQRGDLTDAFPAFTADHPHQPLASEFLNRAALADKLVATNAAYGNPLPDSTVAAIRSDGIFIIAGQQPGLLLGPMYTLLKAISALALARQLRDRVNVPVIPAFWIASEDHDLAEVNHVTITGRRFTCQHDQLKSPGPLPPVANISLTQFKPDLIAFLEQQLPNRPHKPWVLDQIKSIAFDNYPTMFAQLLTRVLGDEQIVLIDPMAMRELTAPVIAAALDRHEAIQSAFDTGRQQLAAAGFTPPL
ncbi:MAG: hypothetical protein CMJ49_04555, partial [Planctomycetaceae bacterium]|nr:hypothetical protein [Planctomycetaceae bacterium]